MNLPGTDNSFFDGIDLRRHVFQNPNKLHDFPCKMTQKIKGSILKHSTRLSSKNGVLKFTPSFPDCKSEKSKANCAFRLLFQQQKHRVRCIFLRMFNLQLDGAAMLGALYTRNTQTIENTSLLSPKSTQNRRFIGRL